MSTTALASYRQIFNRTTVSFSVAGLVARLPISMEGLGLVLLAQHTSGSYGFAGAVSAVALIANAVFAIPQGRLLDRFGQARVLPLVITIWGAALAATIWALSSDQAHATTFGLAALAGAALPSVGTCVRARWSHNLADQPARLHTAYSFEAVADEAVFLIGPITVTMLATAVHPIAGLSAALLTGLIGTLAFAAQRGSEPPAHPQLAGAEKRAPMPWAAIAPLTLVTTALGVLFGAAEVATVALADEQGHKSLSGFLLATWAFGSLMAGLVSGAVSWRSGPEVRLRWGALAMTCAMVPLVFLSSMSVMAMVLLVGGLAISPTLIASMSLAEQVLPVSRLTEGMAFLQTGLAAGLAPGAAVAGIVIDHQGASAAYLVCVAGGGAALLGALLVRVPDSLRFHELDADDRHRDVA